MSAVMPTSPTAPSVPAANPAAMPAPTAAPPPSRDPAKPLDVDDALQRLARSREDLRQAMLPAPKTASNHVLSSGRVGEISTQISERVKTMPGANVVMDAVHVWWAKHPLNMVGRVAAEATRRYTAPIAERNPVGLILAAVGAGAVLALTRPWRWLLRPALFAGLVPAIAMRALKEIPAESLLNVYSSAVGRGVRRTKTAVPVAPVRAPAAPTARASTMPSSPSTPAIRQTATLP